MKANSEEAVSSLSPPAPRIFEPLDCNVGDPAECTKQLLRQRQRRSQILAVARRMIASSGYEDLTVKKVALESGVTPQTVHNLIGGKARLLAEAVDDYIAAAHRFACSAEGYPNPCIALGDIYWKTAVRYERYVKNSTISFFRNDSEYSTIIHNYSTRLVSDALRQMRDQGRIDQRADLRSMADRLCCLTVGTTFEWSVGRLGINDLRLALQDAYDFCLRGFLPPDESELLDGWRAALKENRPSARIC